MWANFISINALMLSKQDPVDDLDNGEDGDPKEDSKPAGHVDQDNYLSELSF